MADRRLRRLRVNCIDGIEANVARLESQIGSFVGVITALIPHIGYANAAKLAKKSLETNQNIADMIVEAGLLSCEEVTELLAPRSSRDGLVVDAGPGPPFGITLMETSLFLLQLGIVLVAIVMGVRSGGIGLGAWGFVGLAVLVFGFSIEPGSPPYDVIFIILTAVTAASVMEAAGGTAWMVAKTARLIERQPKAVVFLAPLASSSSPSGPAPATWCTR
ncbi:MAG: anaerobic C4-dicarboxylate transporter family protein [Candidatus Binatia bacterium]